MESHDAGSARDHRSRIDWIVLAAAVVLLVSSPFVRTPAGIEPTTAIGGLVVLGLIALVWRRAVTARESETGGDDGVDPSGNEGDSSVWNAIPPWQYDGRHVESGGLARGEQEQALQEIQHQADELSDDPSKNQP